ncbi:MAG: site-2 protease family protein [Clostridiales Family XIII bacterium]|jgi:regulator of sigma E protease|nr:site-2 protease family protein [Clostridiales Family XIII bacterium]
MNFSAIGIIETILALLLLIFVHETGHLLVAKLFRVQVNEFMLGMGPKITSFKRGETEYAFRALPIGGACVLEGEDEDSDNPRAFTNKPARVRALVLAAGSLMNFALAIVVLAMVIFFTYIPQMQASFVEGLLFFFRSFGYAVEYAATLMRMMVEVLGQLVTRKIGMDGVTGPIGMASAFSETAEMGPGYLWQLVALISLNLGIVNLLPFPALDGGRLIFLVIRKITGKRVTNQVEGMFHLVGIMLLFAFMIFITFQDVGRFIVHKE